MWKLNVPNITAANIFIRVSATLLKLYYVVGQRNEDVKRSERLYLESKDYSSRANDY